MVEDSGRKSDYTNLYTNTTTTTTTNNNNNNNDNNNNNHNDTRVVGEAR